MADYNLIIPKAELEKVVADEMALYKKGYRIQIDKRGNIIKASAAISVAEEAWRAKGIMEGAIGSCFWKVGKGLVGGLGGSRRSRGRGLASSRSILPLLHSVVA